jgi:hypothetical protein
MKIIPIALLALTLNGCASLQEPTKQRAGNTVVSVSYPSANFKVSSEFRFVGGAESHMDAVTEAQETGSSQIDNTAFVYADIAEGKIKKVAVVRFMRMQKTRWTFSRVSEWSRPGVIYGKVDTPIGEMESYSGFLSADDFMSSFGLSGLRGEREQCAASVILRQIPQGMARYKHRIEYAEFFSCDNSNQFYYGDGSLTGTGRLRLEMAVRNALDSVKIVGGN